MTSTINLTNNCLADQLSDSLAPTIGQLERLLSQRTQALYRNLLGHQPSKVICHLLSDKLAIIAEDAITPVEKLLVTEGREELALQVRSGIDGILKIQLKALIEEVLKVDVTDLLNNTTLPTGYNGMIAILTKSPQVRKKKKREQRQLKIEN